MIPSRKASCSMTRRFSPVNAPPLWGMGVLRLFLLAQRQLPSVSIPASSSAQRRDRFVSGHLLSRSGVLVAFEWLPDFLDDTGHFLAVMKYLF